MRARTPIAIAISIGACGAGCNAIMDLGRFSEATTTHDAGPTADAGPPAPVPDAAPPGPFDCLNDPNESLNPASVTLHVLVDDATQTITAAGAIDGGSDLDEVIYTPTPGVTVTPCTSFDPSCAKPQAPPQVTDDGGLVTFSLPGNFNGFFQFTGPNSVGFTLFPGQWLTGVTEATYGTSSLSPDSEGLLNLALGNAVDLDAGSGLGEVFIVAYDCMDHHIPGVSLTMSHTGPTTLPFYILNGVPSTTAGVTDTGGVGGALNMPSGPLLVTATLAATSTVIGTVNLYVRAGELSYGWIRLRTH